MAQIMSIRWLPMQCVMSLNFQYDACIVSYVLMFHRTNDIAISYYYYINSNNNRNNVCLCVNYMLLCLRRNEFMAFVGAQVRLRIYSICVEETSKSIRRAGRCECLCMCGSRSATLMASISLIHENWLSFLLYQYYS